MRALFLLAALLAPPAADVSRELTITVGRSALVEFPLDIGRISAGNPDVVDAVAVSTREALINTKKVGNGSVAIWSRSGERVMYHVTVQPDIEPLRQLLKDSFPGEDLQLHWTQDPEKRDALALTGSTRIPAVAERAALLFTPFAKSVVNNIRVILPAREPQKQILLRVRFAELNRSATQSFGVNLLSTGAGNTPGSITTGQFQAPKPSELAGTIGGGVTGTTSRFSISDVLNIFAFRPDLNLGAFIRALQSKGLLQILAEPNLVTTDGKEASFLVGGEFPVPIVQGGQNAGSITVIFREFGIRLSFKPNLTENGTVVMMVRPEVSSIDQANAVLYSGFLIPALATRKMETNVELQMGQSFVIAGLIDDRVTENMSKIPGLSAIPLLGQLFKSRQETKAKTELIVMVTPELAGALPPEATGPPSMPREFLTPELVMPSGPRQEK